MRVLQLIDSLRPGGAERMAVNYSNALSRRVEGSFLCATRMEGALKKALEPEVGYLFLEKKGRLDLKALWRLRNFVSVHKIEIIQAHSSSFFMAVLVKMLMPSVMVVWHDHLGARAKEDQLLFSLKLASRFFDGVIAVNEALVDWSKRNLNSSKVIGLPNFLLEAPKVEVSAVSLQGEGFKIICLANLRPEKDHLNLIEAFSQVQEKYPDVSLHLIGKDEGDHYSSTIQAYIHQLGLSEMIYIYGVREEVDLLLKQGDLGVLSSASEGLPMALLEYGQAGLPVVCTDVGDCRKVIGRVGKLVPARNPKALATAILEYVNDKDRRHRDGVQFQNHVREHYSEETVMGEVVQWLGRL